MQKLSEKLKDTPTNTSLVRSSVSRSLNKEKTLSVIDKVRSDNNSEENQQSGKTEQDLRVPVLNMRGEPLMPTTPAKARHLLNQGKTDVVTRKPFTIQLKYATGEAKQPITLGVDSGYKKVGISAVSNKKELFSAEVTLRTDIPKKIQNKSLYRRNRRNRLWHRQPRFDNRSKPKGWLAPSIRHKLDSHIRLIDAIKKLLPITQIIVEVANFDIQKIKNPDISGVGYQQGEQLGFWNVREYVLHRDNHTCQQCKGKSRDKILQVHHISGKKEGATDCPDELLTVCKTCHDNHHKGIDIIHKKKIKNFKPETFMTTVRWKLVNQLKEMYGDIVHYTYGHITKGNRIQVGLPKSHVNDAFIIADGAIDIQRCIPYIFKQAKRNNRSVQINRKGFKPSIRRQRYKLQPNDLVRYDGGQCRVKGVHCYGKYIVLVNRLMDKIDIKVEKVELIHYGKGIFA